MLRVLLKVHFGVLQNVKYGGWKYSIYRQRRTQRGALGLKPPCSQKFQGKIGTIMTNFGQKGQFEHPKLHLAPLSSLKPPLCGMPVAIGFRPRQSSNVNVHDGDGTHRNTTNSFFFQGSFSIDTQSA